jgi:proteic killer suppression protein
MIRSFKDRLTEKVFRGENPKGFQVQVLKVARRKLLMINAAVSLADLRIPPANRLETLKGNRKGQHSIRVNDQFRVCLIWSDKGAEQVEITDYH